MIESRNFLNSFKQKLLERGPTALQWMMFNLWKNASSKNMEFRDNYPSIWWDECVYQYCSKLPEAPETALDIMSAEGWFWFCNPCRGTVKKTIKDMVKPLTPAKITESLTLIKTPLRKDKSFNKLDFVASECKPQTTCHEKEFLLSKLDEHKSQLKKKVSSSKIVEFRAKMMEKLFDSLGEEKTDITNIRRLSKKTQQIKGLELC